MRRGFLRSSIGSIAALLLATGSTAKASELGAYLEDLARNQRPGPEINFSRASLPKVQDSLVEPSPAQTTPSEVEFIEGRWRLNDKEPCLLVRSGDLTYCLKLGARHYYSSVTESILGLLRLPRAPRSLVQNLRVMISPSDRVRLAQFLAKIPTRFDWSRTFSEIEGGLQVKMGVLETDWSSSGSWSWSSVSNSRSATRLLLAVSWLQCSLIRQNLDHATLIQEQRDIKIIENLQACLGLGASISNVNLFVNDWVTSSSVGAKFNNPFLDKAYMEAFERLSKEDLEDFYALASSLSPDLLELQFVSNGFPQALARLYVLKLMARLNSLGSVLGHPPIRQMDPLDFTAEPQIQQGQVVGDFDDFPVDLTQSALESLLWDLGRRALRPIDDFARQLISTLPYNSIEVAHFGNFHLAPGIMFRMSRTVAENPKPTGPNDLYLVRDELDLTLTVGVAVERDLRIGSGWADAGAGYRRVYVKIHPAPSRKAARDSYWSIPYDNLWLTDFDRLNSGEVWAIQSGWVGMVVAGGSVRGFKIRPSGYIMGMADWLSTFQVARQPDGSIILAEGYDEDFFIQAKAYWRFINRYIRLPFAGASWRRGTQEARSLVLTQEDLNPPDIMERLNIHTELARAYSDQDLRPLEKRWPTAKRLTEYDLNTSFFNFYFLQLTQGDSLSRVVMDQHEGEVDVIRAHRSIQDRYTGAERGWNCITASLLARKSRNSPIHNGYLQLDCWMALESPSKADLAEQVRRVAESLDVKFSTPDLTKGEPGEFGLHYRLELPWEMIRPILANEPEGWVRTLFDQVINDPFSEVGGEQWVKRLPLRNLAIQMSAIRAVSDPSTRVRQFAEAIVVLGIQNPMFADLLREIPDKYTSIDIFNQAEFSTRTLDLKQEFGRAISSPLKDLYEDHFLSYENLIVNTF